MKKEYNKTVFPRTEKVKQLNVLPLTKMGFTILPLTTIFENLVKGRKSMKHSYTIHHIILLKS